MNLPSNLHLSATKNSANATPSSPPLGIATKKHWSDVYYDNYDTTFVKALIREAYELVRGKKVRG